MLSVTVDQGRLWAWLALPLVAASCLKVGFSLEVAVLDPEGRVACARLDGEPPSERSHGSWSWQLDDAEPRWPLEIGLIPDR